MCRITFLVCFTLFFTAGFAQNSATATATVNIITPIGVTETASVVNNIQFNRTATLAGKNDKARLASGKTLAFANFKVPGAGTHLVSLLLSSPMVRLVNSKSQKSFELQDLQITTAAANETERFVVKGKAALNETLPAGDYANTAPVDVIIYFN